MIIYTDRFIPEEKAGCTYWFIILIKPEYKEDIGLLNHEREHVEQFWNMPILHGLFYRFSREYRKACEVAAYREQLKYYDTDKSERFARFLTDWYDLNITYQEALELLREK